MANLTLALPTPFTPPQWLVEQDASAQINAALNGQMHRERWKYTKSQPVLDMLPLTAAPPEFESLPEGTHLEVLNRKNSNTPVEALERVFGDAP